MGSVSTIYNGVRTWLAGRALMDVAFSNRSTNGLQNKIITAKKDEIEGRLDSIESDLDNQLIYAELTGTSPADTTTPVAINLPDGFTTDNTHIVSAMVKVSATWFDMQGYNSAYAGQYALAVTANNILSVTTLAANSFSHDMRILIARKKN